MSMMKMNIKYKKIGGVCVVLLLLIIVIISYVKITDQTVNHNNLELQTFRTDGGWGYTILLNKKTIISQPIIPAIDTVMPFPDEKSAKRIGQIVVKKIINKENFSVSKQEVEYSLSY